MEITQDQKTFSNEKKNSLLTFLERTKDGKYSEVSSSKDPERISIGTYQISCDEQYFYSVR